MIENTSQRDAALHLLGAMSDGTDTYITDMEAAGQRQLVASTELPASGPWGELEALGFAKGEPVRDDALFVQATLPEGWRKERTDHSMWSQIVDERGVARVKVFYKAAFYDRRANFHVVNVGGNLATQAIWGDEPVALPSSWGVLTADERRDYAAALASRLEHEIEYFQHFEGRELEERRAHADRIRALIALTEENAR
ncbi:hypothetical protein [Nocardia wallacei]|uniref:hypothetical protein n=1 Tax=Nocardia wallacei TaxID=480035 RepID=UPI002458DD60|nr:hypothetical protein [Nocardia wallacei]